MRKTFLVILSVFIPLVLSAGDFMNRFLERYGESDKPLNNVNIGTTMLERMAENSNDEELRNAFNELKSIRIVNSENPEDSRYYFGKAHELVNESFNDYEEVVSVSEGTSKTSIFMKRESDDHQDLILITLDYDGKFTLITLAGKIDFKSISKLSGSLKSDTAISGGGYN